MSRAIRIVAEKHVIGTPALRLAIAGWHELLEQELINPLAFLFHWDNALLYAEDAETKEVLGVLIYVESEGFMQHRMHVNFGYVKPVARGQDVYHQLWRHLAAKAKKDGVVEIEAGTHVRNELMKRSLEREGRTPYGIMYHYNPQTDPTLEDVHE